MEQLKLRGLLQDMSLEEKVGQMIQLPSHLFAEGGLVTGSTESFEIKEEEISLVGSTLGNRGAENLRKIQEDFMAKHPHHIPLMFMMDVINGLETIFPIPLALGCTFSPEIVEKVFRASAKESAASGLHVTFSPMLDLGRDARWGRVMESTGEDPWLNGQLGRAMVRGYQGSRNVKDEQGFLKEEGTIAACVKHFAAYGAPDGGRDYDNVELSERTLREDYLLAYKEGIEEGCMMVMTAFHSLNRMPCTGDQWLMRKILREEMKFDGVLISDYGSVEDMVVHGAAENCKEAAKMAVLAGVDIDMVSNAYAKYLVELVREGEVEERLIDEAVWRILNLKNELGLFENPFKDASKVNEEKLFHCNEHRELAREAAASSFVLLKNDNILPLEKESDEKIAFIGPYADHVTMYGAWSFPSEPGKTVTVKQGTSNKKADMIYLPGCPILDKIEHQNDVGKVKNSDEQKDMEDAIEAARNADKVVLCIGDEREQSGESRSKTCLKIAQKQQKLMEEVAKVNPNIITVLFCGRPMEINDIVECSKAVLLVWMPGTEGGNAIADVLFGDKCPEGRLSMCIPRSVGQAPIYYNRFMTGKPNPTGTAYPFYNGYIDNSTKPLYPFGYGLSYTDYAYSEISLDKAEMTKEDKIIAKVVVTNVGACTGTETVQMYLRDVKGSVIRPVKMLRGVKKVTLEPGESKEISFEITEEMLKFYDINMKYTSEPGEFYVFIGHDSDVENRAVFKLK